MSEWSNVLVSKTSVPKGTGGSNPPFCARETVMLYEHDFYFEKFAKKNFSEEKYFFILLD